MPKLLIERSEALNYESVPDNKHYLGKLSGVGATFNKPTRNNRRYPYELWVNVENSDDFKEGMATHTIFGEADHPEDRIETSIKEVAIVLVKYEIRKAEGIVYTEFHILNTPNGRIIKELLDYGSKIGVSTRGLGDEIERDGEIIIDPDTYCFYAWDAVVMPAVKDARPDMTVDESVSKMKRLSESISREIDSAATASELESIRNMVNNLEIPGLDSINESIDKRIASVSGEDDILSDMENELGSISSENLILKEENDRLRGMISANNIRLSESRESSRKQRQLIRDLRSRLAYHIKEEGSLRESIYQSSMENEGLSSKIATIEEKLNSGNSEMSRLSESISSKDRTISRLKSSNEELRSELSNLKADLSESENKISRLNRDHKSKMKKINENMCYLLYRYLLSKCNQAGVDPEIAKMRLGTNYTYEDIDKVVEDLSDTKDRYSKLPFENVSRVRSMVVESSMRNREDEQTMEFIKSATNI